MLANVMPRIFTSQADQFVKCAFMFLVLRNCEDRLLKKFRVLVRFDQREQDVEAMASTSAANPKSSLTPNLGELAGLDQPFESCIGLRPRVQGDRAENLIILPSAA